MGFSEIMPAMGTPIRGLYITDSSQYYPEDRTLSASVKLGSSVAELFPPSTPFSYYFHNYKTIATQSTRTSKSKK